MTHAELALRYAAFAALATGVNVATQHVSLTLYARPPFGLPLAVAAGTGTGLVAKYFLDKTWIFGDRSSGLAAHSRLFALYVLMGLVTTALFWGTEWAFHAAFGTALMRDIGAVIGLSMGYFTKYQLDKRFVFQADPAS